MEVVELFLCSDTLAPHVQQNDVLLGQLQNLLQRLGTFSPAVLFGLGVVNGEQSLGERAESLVRLPGQRPLIEPHIVAHVWRQRVIVEVVLRHGADASLVFLHDLLQEGLLTQFAFEEFS